MTAAEELDAAQLTLVVEFFDEQILAAVDDGLHHHVDLADLTLELDDLAALVDRGAHGDGAGHVFAGLERGDRLRCVIGDRRVDVNGVYVGVLEQLVVAGVALGDFVAIADLVHFGLVAAADGVHLGVGMGLVNGDKLGSEAQPDDRHAYFSGHKASLNP